MNFERIARSSKSNILKLKKIFLQAIDADNPTMKYSLVSPLIGEIVNYMPITCGSLANAWCPLKRGENVSYSTTFRILPTMPTWREFGYYYIKTSFRVDLFKNNSTSEIFSVELDVKFQPCFLYIFEVCVIHSLF